jgi:hypothetical protein
MYNLDLFVTAIYCFLCNDPYPAYCQRFGKPRRSGFELALSDAERLTIELVGQFSGYSNQKQLYEQMRTRFGSWFPGLKDRTAFIRQSANLWQIKAWMQQDLVIRLGGHRHPLQIIDTVPLLICKLARVVINARFFKQNPSLNIHCLPKAITLQNKNNILDLKAVSELQIMV